MKRNPIYSSFNNGKNPMLDERAPVIFTKPRTPKYPISVNHEAKSSTLVFGPSVFKATSKSSSNSKDIIETPQQVLSTTEKGSSSDTVTEPFDENEAARSLLMLFYSESDTQNWKVTDEGEQTKEESTNMVEIARASPWKYRCEPCQLSFKSFQALGGHKANHKRIRHVNVLSNEMTSESLAAENISRVPKCPTCGKIFKTSQALGGHKKVHLPEVIASKKQRTKYLIDLNLPPSE